MYVAELDYLVPASAAQQRLGIPRDEGSQSLAINPSATAISSIQAVCLYRQDIDLYAERFLASFEA